jgi:adhesin/invasin
MAVALKGATRLVAGAGMAVSLLFAAGCDDDDDPFVPVVTTITMTSGSPQTVARNGTSQPLTVTVRDQSGDPISGRTVTWAVATGGGTLSSTSSQTNAQGVATMTYTAGAPAGAATVTATVGTLPPVTFNITVSP